MWRLLLESTIYRTVNISDTFKQQIWSHRELANAATQN